MKFKVIASEPAANVTVRELTVDAGSPVSFGPSDAITFAVADDAGETTLSLVDVGGNGRRSAPGTYTFDASSHAAPGTPEITGVEFMAE